MGIDCTFQPLCLFSSSLDHFQQTTAIIIDRIDNLHYVIDELLLDNLIECVLLLKGGGRVDLKEPAFKI